MAPALAHGASLGPFDLLSRYGLSSRSGVVVHNSLSSDQIDAFIPWTNLAWTQVHHGHLPLWNPYSALGMPLAFNWQSAPFSVAAVVGYLFPVHLAYTAQVLVTLVIAGTGVYVLGRVLGLGVLGCTMAATVYELSGPFMGWLGWPVATVMSFAGWLFVAAILVVRGERRAGLCRSSRWCWPYRSTRDNPRSSSSSSSVWWCSWWWSWSCASRPWGAPPSADPSSTSSSRQWPVPRSGAPLPFRACKWLRCRFGGGRLLRIVALHDLAHVIFQGFDGAPRRGQPVVRRSELRRKRRLRRGDRRRPCRGCGRDAATPR